MNKKVIIGVIGILIVLIGAVGFVNYKKSKQEELNNIPAKVWGEPMLVR